MSNKKQHPHRYNPNNSSERRQNHIRYCILSATSIVPSARRNVALVASLRKQISQGTPTEPCFSLIARLKEEAQRLFAYAQGMRLTKESQQDFDSAAMLARWAEAWRRRFMHEGDSKNSVALAVREDLHKALSVLEHALYEYNTLPVPEFQAVREMYDKGGYCDARR